MAITNLKGTPTNATNSGTTIATATVAGITGSTMYITDLACASDLAGSVMTAKVGATVVWEHILSANTTSIFRFGSPLSGTSGSSMSVTVNGTALCKANIAGYYL